MAKKPSPAVKLVCAICGRMFERRYVSTVNRYGSENFCSRTCAYKRSRKGTTKNNNWVADKFGSHSDSRSNIGVFVKRRYEDKCVICGEVGHCDAHHIIPIREGGSNALTNLVLLCPNDHRLADRGIINRERLFHARRNMVVRSDLPMEVRNALLA